MRFRWPHHGYALILGCIYAVLFIVAAIDPHDRLTWVLENGLPLILIPVLFATRNVLPLSRISYTLIFVFLCLHTVGSHYTYSYVPYNEWFESLTGHRLNRLLGWERNHYDRLVHFCYGLLIAYPIRELFLRVAAARGFWGYFLPLDVAISSSAVYELIEWAAAVLFADGAADYVGLQGDEWDAQKDIALASLGALIAMMVTAGVNIALGRDLAREFTESFRVKRRRPLGEDSIRDGLRKKQRRGRRGA